MFDRMLEECPEISIHAPLAGSDLQIYAMQ